MVEHIGLLPSPLPIFTSCDSAAIGVQVIRGERICSDLLFKRYLTKHAAANGAIPAGEHFLHVSGE